MTWEAIRLQSWYATPQGAAVATLAGNGLVPWLEVAGKVGATFCLGYTQPYLERIAPWSDTLLVAAPAEMGAAPWPPGEANRTLLCRVENLPFPDETFDRVVMIHLLEGCASPAGTLREVWRVLRPGGRLLLLVPNRGGLWARLDGSPLGWGRPFSPRQLEELLTGSMFCPRQYRYALFLPPFAGARWLRSALAWEKAGHRWFSPLGGLIQCDAEKVVYAVPRLAWPALERKRGYELPVPLADGRGERAVDPESSTSGNRRSRTHPLGNLHDS